MKQTPVIGLLTRNETGDPGRSFLSNAYTKAIIGAGGTPVLLPYQPKQQLFQLVALLDGLVVPGGIDLDPNRYGENPLPGCGEVDPWTDELDLTAIGFALQSDLPILAICRGAQALNVALGGTLVQDIPSMVKDALKHSQQAPRWYGSHEVAVQPSSLLGRIWGNPVSPVNSFHHQSIAKLGRSLRITATAPDGVIEAVEGTDFRFVLGLQWHPELMVGHYPAAARVFQSFVEACAN